MPPVVWAEILLGAAGAGTFIWLLVAGIRRRFHSMELKDKDRARINAPWEVDDWNEGNDTVVGIRRIARLDGWEEIVEEQPIFRISMRDPEYPDELRVFKEQAKQHAAARNGQWSLG